MSEVVVVGSFIAQPGKEAEGAEAFRALVEPTHDEDGCILYALHHGTDDPRRLAFVERWSSRESSTPTCPAPTSRTCSPASRSCSATAPTSSSTRRSRAARRRRARSPRTPGTEPGRRSVARAREDAGQVLAAPTPSLRYAFCRWLSTVRTDITRRSAIWRLLAPPAASSAISRSRDVSSEASGAANIVGGRASSHSPSQRAARPAAARALAARPASRSAAAAASAASAATSRASSAAKRSATCSSAAPSRAASAAACAPRSRRTARRRAPRAPRGRARRRRIAEPAERVQGAGRVRVLAAVLGQRRRLTRVVARRRELAARRRAPGSAELDLDREALVAERRALELGDHGACRTRLPRLRRGLGDGSEGEGEHADAVALAQQGGALAAVAKRGLHAPPRQPDQAEDVRLDRRARRRRAREQVAVGALGERRRLDEPAGDPQRHRAHAEQHDLGGRALLAVRARERQRFLGERERLVDAPRGEQRLDAPRA